MDDRLRNAMDLDCACRGCNPRRINRAAQARRLGLGPLAPQPLGNAGDAPAGAADITARSEIRREVTDAAL